MNTKQVSNIDQSAMANAEERAFAREALVYNVTEDLLVILEDLGISKKELARRLGKSRSYITQILSGSRNMTLGSLSDMCYALGFKPQIQLPVQLELEPELKSEMVNKKPKQSFEKWESLNVNPPRPQKVTRKSVNVIDRRDPIHWAKAA